MISESKGRKLYRIFLRPSKDKERDELTNFAICGDYACWRAGNATYISVLNVHEVIKNKDKYSQFEEFFEKKIDLSDFVDRQKVVEKQRQAISMDACSPLYALHAISDESLSEKAIIKRCNSLQVTIGSRGLVYDLSTEKKNSTDAIAISEIPAMKHLLKV